MSSLNPVYLFFASILRSVWVFIQIYVLRRQVSELSGQLKDEKTKLESLQGAVKTENEIEKAQDEKKQEWDEVKQGDDKAKIDALTKFCLFAALSLFCASGCMTPTPVAAPVCYQPIIRIPARPTINMPTFPADPQGNPILTANERAMLDVAVNLAAGYDTLEAGVRAYNERAEANNAKVEGREWPLTEGQRGIYSSGGYAGSYRYGGSRNSISKGYPPTSCLSDVLRAAGHGNAAGRTFAP